MLEKGEEKGVFLWAPSLRYWLKDPDYGKSYDEFSQTVPDTVKGHDDWIEWTYLVKVANELSAKIEKLRLLIGK